MRQNLRFVSSCQSCQPRLKGKQPQEVAFSNNTIVLHQRIERQKNFPKSSKISYHRPDGGNRVLFSSPM
jgi:hypothetical protein